MNQLVPEREAACSSVSNRDVAIVGMACVFPGAKNLQQYWENIVSKVDAVGEPPPEWEAELYCDPGAESNDRVYSARGGYLGKLAEFDPFEYGVMPNSVDGGEPDHFLALRAAHEALADAGIRNKDLGRENTEVIIGRGTYVNRGNATVIQHGLMVDQVLRVLKQLHPEHTPEDLAAIKEKLKASLPPFHAETAPSLVPNIISGRISNRLDLMGPNYIIDAACASSLVAVDLGMRDLLSGRCDMVIAGGVHASTPPPIVMIFCQLKAISRSGQIRPFHANADGTLLGEGVGMVVLKRRADAERDGDRIYAILKGVGSSSDGRALGLLAPRREGEELALRRAYEAAGVEPETVGLIEAHGTATAVGDVVEVEALSNAFGPRRGDLPHCALGSVKSMISHLMPASGVAGLIKTALSLHHKVLPPTLHCEEPNPKLGLEKSVFYINTETRPWIHSGHQSPRRAGVNAFGFGGINAHAVLEEYAPGVAAEEHSLHHNWDSEVFVFSAENREQLIRESERVAGWLASQEEIVLKDLAYTLNVAAPMGPCRLAIVAGSREDLQTKLSRAATRLQDERTRQIRNVNGVYYFSQPLAERGKLAFVFPGEGSQYDNMLADLCIHFPEVRSRFDLMDRAFAEHPRGYLPSQAIFPPPRPAKEKKEADDKERLWQMDSGAEAVFAANQALGALLTELQVRPDAMVGHSTGEHSALLEAGVVRATTDEALIAHVLGVNGAYENLRKTATLPEGELVAVAGADWALLESLAEKSNGNLFIAMDNCPHQVVLCGTGDAVKEAVAELEKRLAICQPLRFARPYHTPWFEVFSNELRTYFDGVEFAAPQINLYSCLTADRFPAEPEIIRSLVAMQWSGRVRFRETVEKMYADGVRIFVEVGPRGNLTGFLNDILNGREYAAIPANVMHRSGIQQLHHMIGQLAAYGVSLSLERLYERRAPQRLEIGAAPAEKKASRSIPLRSGMQALRLPPDFALPKRAAGSGQNGKPDAPAPQSVSQPVPASPVTAKPGSPPAAARVALPPPVARPATPSVVTEARRTPAGAPAGRAAAVVEGHFRTMEQFLKVQSDVMSTYLGKATARRSAPASPPSVRQMAPAIGSAKPRAANSAASHPFVDSVTELVPGRKAVATRRLAVWDRDILFQDHTLGRNVSESDPALLGHSVVPLTITMEILAEGGALLHPGKVLVGMRSIRAHRWITFEQPEVMLQIAAESSLENPDAAVVSIREQNPENGSTGPVIAEGVMVFAAQYPVRPAAGEFRLQQERPSTWTVEQLYREGMFHGATFQTVKSVDRTGSDGNVATMEALPRQQMFRDNSSPQFLTDPVLLDGAGQVVAYWIKESIGQGVDIFPYSLAVLHFYAPPPPVGTRVECRVSARLLGETQMTSDIDLVLPDGTLYGRMEGWEDRRFYLPQDFLRLRIAPKETVLSQPWTEPLSGLPGTEVICCRLNSLSAEFLEAHHSIWLKVLADLVLSRKEREQWRSSQAVPKRRREWLLGRCVAKDTVRLLVKKRFGVDLCLADVEIATDSFGAPKVEGHWMEKLGVSPVVSISHSNEAAVALAALDRSQLVGIDIESLSERRGEFAALAFSSGEQQLLSALGPEQRQEWRLRLWCAKEAVAKALGRGFSGGPGAVEAVSVEWETGMVKVAMSDGLLQELPEFRGREFFARTGRDGDAVFAAVLCEAGVYQR